MPKLLTVTICGGGNGAHTTAGYLAAKPGFCVNVLTRRPKEWSKDIIVFTNNSNWEYRGSFLGHLNIVTDDPSLVIPNSDIVLIASPANTNILILERIKNYLEPHCLIGTIFAQGGFDWAVLKALNNDLSRVDGIFGLQHIPWLCRIVEYGKKVKIMGAKNSIWVASIPVEKSKIIANLLTLIFDIPAEIVPNFLTMTLTPSNQIIHPGRYYGIFNKWDGRTPMKKEDIQWGLYTDMDDVSVYWIKRLDDELQLIKKTLLKRYPSLDLSYVKPIAERLVIHYGNDISDKSSLKNIFRTNRSYNACTTPTQQVSGGYIPALDSRLFWEDIPSGLCILKDIAEMLSIETPNIDYMINWHQQFMGKQFLLGDRLNRDIINETDSPTAYGIDTLEKLVMPSLSKANQKKFQSQNDFSLNKTFRFSSKF